MTQQLCKAYLRAIAWDLLEGLKEAFRRQTAEAVWAAPFYSSRVASKSEGMERVEPRHSKADNSIPTPFPCILRLWCLSLFGYLPRMNQIHVG